MNELSDYPISLSLRNTIINLALIKLIIKASTINEGARNELFGLSTLHHIGWN